MRTTMLKQRSLLLGLIFVIVTDAQRAPCYECEMYKDAHPDSNPYEEIRSHCTYPCQCGEEPRCPQGVTATVDGCGCCRICARQAGEECDGTRLCDENQGLVCQYPGRLAATGTCRAIKGLPCQVNNRTYDNGETFLLDCRTQCTCQNGTYACSSLCPDEALVPGHECRHPRLVEVPGRCCREWMCDGEPAWSLLPCPPTLADWTSCTSPCGIGISSRASTSSPQCRSYNETRLCQTRPCGVHDDPIPLHHRMRKGRACKATRRVSRPVYLYVGECQSERRYRPKYCGSCDATCTPQLSTTIAVHFFCPVRTLSLVDEATAGKIVEAVGAAWPQNMWREEEGRRRNKRGANWDTWADYGDHDEEMFGEPSVPMLWDFETTPTSTTTPSTTSTSTTSTSTTTSTTENSLDDAEEEEDGLQSYRKVVLQVQWVIKCHCDDPPEKKLIYYPPPPRENDDVADWEEEDETPATVEEAEEEDEEDEEENEDERDQDGHLIRRNEQGEVLLHRVHRTAP